MKACIYIYGKFILVNLICTFNSLFGTHLPVSFINICTGGVYACIIFHSWDSLLHVGMFTYEQQFYCSQFSLHFQFLLYTLCLYETQRHAILFLVCVHFHHYRLLLMLASSCLDRNDLANLHFHFIKNKEFLKFLFIFVYIYIYICPISEKLIQ